MSDPEVVPAIDPSKSLNLDLPPVAIILIGASGYILLLLFIFTIRYFLRTKGACQNEICECAGFGGDGCCQCIEGCADACLCGTPTIDKCLDSCCPKRKLDCVSIILCQCCASSNQNQCCGEGPCCSYGDLECNCACIQPDFDRVNCLCCQLGTNYNRANDID